MIKILTKYFFNKKFSELRSKYLQKIIKNYDDGSLEPNLKIPKHLAIIMDGNARWAKNNNLELKDGHNFGCENIELITNQCLNIGVKYLTLYAFSSENWQRPQNEVSYLLDLLKFYLDYKIEKLNQAGVKILVSGRLDNLEESLIDKIKSIENLTSNNQKIVLNIAFSYGGREEIKEGLIKIAKKVLAKEIDIKDIDEDSFRKYLYQPEIPDPDLLIRTGGDIRISNFLLWQIAYSELYFTETLWPDFKNRELKKAIINFNQRKRTYGKR